MTIKYEDFLTSDELAEWSFLVGLEKEHLTDMGESILMYLNTIAELRKEITELAEAHALVISENLDLLAKIMEAEADEDIANGDYETYDDMGDLIINLDEKPD